MRGARCCRPLGEADVGWLGVMVVSEIGSKRGSERRPIRVGMEEVFIDKRVTQQQGI